MSDKRLSRKIAQLSDEEDNEGLEELDKTLIRTQQEFGMGTEDSKKYESSPEDILKDYQDFN